MWRLHSFLVLASAGSQPENLSIFDPASPAATSTRFLFYLVIAISAAILLLVETVLLYSLLVGRRPPDSIEPPQVYGSMPIEIAWTAAPALIVFLLWLIQTRTEFQVKVNPDNPPRNSNPLYVTVIGHQWWWEYVYSRDYHGKPTQIITANELHVPASDDTVARPVYLALQSADVCHSFWIPRLAGKTDLIPGRTNQMWFQTREQGLFLGQCAEYCGSQHAHMLLRVVVDSPEVFDAWLDAQRKPAEDDASVRAGRDAFLAQSCVNCHRVRGTGAKGAFGPDLTHLMSRQTLASGMIPNTREQLRKWLVDPQKIKPSCLMPAFGLSDEQVDLIVGYLTTLK